MLEVNEVPLQLKGDFVQARMGGTGVTYLDLGVDDLAGVQLDLVTVGWNEDRGLRITYLSTMCTFFSSRA